MILFLSFDGASLNETYEGKGLLHWASEDMIALTFNKASPCPFHLCRDDNPRGDRTFPHNAGTCLDNENATTRYVWRFGRRQHNNMVVEVTIYRLIVNFAFSLLRPDAIIQRLDVRHVAREQV